MLIFVKAAVSDQRGISGRSGNKKSGEAIEKTESKKIGTEKSPEGTKNGPKRRPLFAAFELALKINVRVIIYFCDVTIDGRIREMMEIAAEFFAFAA